MPALHTRRQVDGSAHERDEVARHDRMVARVGRMLALHKRRQADESAHERDEVAGHDRMVAPVEHMLELPQRRQVAGSAHERELLPRQIESTDREIDALVDELCALTPEEIGVIDGTPAPSSS